MQTPGKKFEYGKCHKIIYWGYEFDSLLELKYAITIKDEYEFIRGICIYYNPKTRQPTNYIREGIRRYTPDFLVRNKLTNEVFWVEIKPRAYNDEEKLQRLKEIAENYIRWKNYDWKFKIIYDDEIILSDGQLKNFMECRKLVDKSARKISFQQKNNRYDRSRQNLFKLDIGTKRIQFVMFGKEFMMRKEKHFQ